MKRLPEVNLSHEPLSRILYGAVPAKLLLTAIELKVFSSLTEPMSAQTLARAIGTHPQSTQSFLDGLAANELLDKRNGRYSNTQMADTFLVEGLPTYLGDVFRNLNEYMRPALEHMTAAVREGQCPPVQFSDPSLEERETEIYANSQRSGRAQQAAAMISKLPEFPQMKRMLDLGSGAGLIGLAIVAAHPTMTGVLFDQPEVIEGARRFIREYELEDRVTSIGGDYTTDSIGEGYDLVWTSYTIRRHNLDRVVANIHAALSPGGVYVSLAEGLTHERTRPVELINSILPVYLTGNEMMFEEGEIGQAMLRAGFKSVHTHGAGGAQLHGPAIVDVARK